MKTRLAFSSCFPRRFRAAFTIMEMLMVVILLGAVTSILAQLFMMTWQANISSQKRDHLLHRVDSAVDVLRHDAWQARSIGLDGPRRLDMVLATGDSVTWQVSPDGALARTAAGKPDKTRSWLDLPPISFAGTGPLLTMTVHTAPGRDESLTLVSQQLLAKTEPVASGRERQ